MIGLAGMESPTRYWCLTCRSYIASPCAHICQECTMQVDPTPVPAPQPSLRKAAVEALVSGELMLSYVDRSTDICNRFRKALEQLSEELGK